MQGHAMTDISDDAKRNREGWTKANADYTDDQARHNWAASDITWGVFGVPEASLGTLGEVRDLDVVELGSGTCSALASISGKSIPNSRWHRRAVASCAGGHSGDWDDWSGPASSRWSGSCRTA